LIAQKVCRWRRAGYYCHPSRTCSPAVVRRAQAR
jgi:hypothetical protein